MVIDKQQMKAAFAKYVRAYNPEDPKIALKIAHTYRVAGLCEEIATELQLEQELVELSWLTGLLHDIGRFEQVKQYGTFNDAISVNHAEMGARVLFDEGVIRTFTSDASEDSIIRTVIEQHNRFAIDTTLDERATLLCNILRDADKLDILRVNCESPTEDIYDFDDTAISASSVSPAVYAAFYQHGTIDRSIRQYPADFIVGHICFAFGLVFTPSIRILREQGYVYQMLSRTFENEDTARKFKAMNEELRSWVSERLNA